MSVRDKLAEIISDAEWVEFVDDNADGIGSIDISHIAEHAAKIAEGADHA